MNKNLLLDLRGKITQTDIILMIELYNNPMSPQEMCDLLEVTHGSQGVYILRMKKAGMIYTTDRVNRRTKCYHLTEQGEQVVKWIKERIEQKMA